MIVCVCCSSNLSRLLWCGYIPNPHAQLDFDPVSIWKATRELRNTTMSIIDFDDITSPSICLCFFFFFIYLFLLLLGGRQWEIYDYKTNQFFLSFLIGFFFFSVVTFFCVFGTKLLFVFIPLCRFGAISPVFFPCSVCVFFLLFFFF